MIFAQVEANRSYVGCLDVGSQVVASLEVLCKEKGIQCAMISGYGFLEDPVVRRYLRSEKGYSSPVKEEGLFVAPAVNGSISIGEDGQPHLLLFLEAFRSERGRSKGIAGCLVEATVRQFEFRISTIDNVVLRRFREKETGLSLWLQMLPAQLPPRKFSPPPQREVKKQFEPLDDDVLEDDVMLAAGDWLDHPRLGMCLVINFDGEDRIKVKLASGRIAELLFSMFKLTLEGVKDGGRVFRVEMRKKV